MTDSGKNKGFALITVMFVLSIVAILMISLQVKQQQVLRRSSMVAGRAQAYEQLRSAEDYARAALAATFKQTPQLIHNNQLWNKIQYMPFGDNPKISIKISDMQALFNVNTLLGSNINATKQFRGLCKYTEVSDESCQAIIGEFSQRKIDPQMETQPVLEDISELRSFTGVSSPDYVKLKPYIIALSDPKSTINVNTARRELLQAILPEDIYSKLSKLLSDGGYIDKKKLVELGLPGQGLSEGSNYFTILTHTQSGSRGLGMRTSLINISAEDSPAHIEILSREFTN
jgi:general secretion pathway protein K